jgi:hypothetical protein
LADYGGVGALLEDRLCPVLEDGAAELETKPSDWRCGTIGRDAGASCEGINGVINETVRQAAKCARQNLRPAAHLAFASAQARTIARARAILLRVENIRIHHMLH